MSTVPTSFRDCIAATALVVTLTAACNAGAQVGGNLCGPIQRDAGGYGPYDYQTQRSHLEIVERFHFTPQVEALVRGQSATIGGDLSYLMRTSPNHHRGLLAIMKFVERTKNPQPRDMQYSIDCYFERAIRFAPNDVIVRMLFARHLGGRKQLAQAKKQLEYATTLATENGLTHFNIGLTYFELGMYPEALTRAHSARQNGFTGLGLETRLREKGQWTDPAPGDAGASTGTNPATPASAPG